MNLPLWIIDGDYQNFHEAGWCEALKAPMAPAARNGAPSGPCSVGWDAAPVKGSALVRDGLVRTAQDSAPLKKDAELASVRNQCHGRQFHGAEPPLQVRHPPRALHVEYGHRDQVEVCSHPAAVRLQAELP